MHAHTQSSVSICTAVGRERVTFLSSSNIKSITFIHLKIHEYSIDAIVRTYYIGVRLLDPTKSTWYPKWGDVLRVVALCELCAERHETLTALVTNRKVRFNLFNYSNLLICFI